MDGEVNSRPIPPPPPSKTREHWERGKQRLTKLFSVLKKLHSGLGTVGNEWGKMSKHFNKNFSEMYGNDGNGETSYPNFGVWTYLEEEPVKRKKKRKQHK